MKKIIAFCGMLLALCAGATNITNYPVRTTFNANYWFLLSDVANQTNWNLPGNYVASTADLNSASNALWQLTTNLVAAQTNFDTLYVTNLYVDTLTATNLYFTNLFAGDIETTNLYVQYGWITNLYSDTAYITNLYTDSLTVTNLYVTNLFAGDIETTNLTVYSNAWINFLTVTNPITNLSLTANTIVKSDANSALASVANGSGLLTNNGSGTFGWLPLSAVTNINYTFTNLFATNAYFTNLWASNATFIWLASSNAFFTNLWSSNAYFANLWATNAYFTNLWSSNAYIQNGWITNLYSENGWITNLYTDKGYITNIFTQQVKYYTNQGTMAPDFSKGYDAISTNNNFTFLAPINTDANLKFVETTVKKVTNTKGSPILASLPSNINAVPGSVWYITNVTWFTFVVYGNEQTNAYAVPIR